MTISRQKLTRDYLPLSLTSGLQSKRIGAQGVEVGGRNRWQWLGRGLDRRTGFTQMAAQAQGDGVDRGQQGFQAAAIDEIRKRSSFSLARDGCCSTTTLTRCLTMCGNGLQNLAVPSLPWSISGQN